MQKLNLTLDINIRLRLEITYVNYNIMKQFIEAQVDDLIKLRYGRLVTSADHTAYVSNAALGKIFGISGSQVRRLYMARFQSITDQQLPLLLQFTKQMVKHRRQRWGLRFLR